MQDPSKTYQELSEENAFLRQRIQQLEESDAERKWSEEALRASEEKYRSLFDNAVEGFFQSTPEGRFLNVNPAFARIFGYASPEELIATISNISQQYYVNYDDRLRYMEILREKGKVENFEFKARRKDGAVIWLSNSTRAIIDKDSKIICYEGIVEDITERKRAEDALRASEEKHRQLIENSHDIIYTLTTDGFFIFVSPAWTALLGHPVDQVAGHPFQPFVHPDDLTGCLAFLQRVIETGERQEGVEYRVRHRDGSWYWHTSSAVPLRDKAGRVIGFEGIARDITERKRAEEEKEKLILELKDAISKIKTLSGMLPICASCKKIRDDQGYWKQIESYIEDHSSAEFSHSICPECISKLYPELIDP